MTTFGATSTTDDVLKGIDLSGRHFLITGASTGLGEETARALSAHGGSITLAVRDLDRGAAAAGRIHESVPDAALDVRQLDLGSLASVRSFAKAFLADHDHLEVLINNAGVMACPYGVTDDGFELQFGTNHLGHFLLTVLLAPALVAAAPARVVALSSRGHRRASVDLDDPGFQRTSYEPWTAYGRSKTANVLFAVGFDQRFAKQGVRAFAIHPGVIQTELARHLTPETLGALRAAQPAGQSMQFKTIAQGAATSVWSATSPQLDGRGGLYLEDCGIAEVTDDPAAPAGVRSYAVDPVIAESLWVLSERLVGLE